MKILYIEHTGCNLKYINLLFNFIKSNKNEEITKISLEQFVLSDIKFDEIDYIFYQTWPDDRLFENGDIRKPINDYNMINILNGKLHRKFPKDIIEQADIKFLKINKKTIKILVDVHDDGNADSFSRFLNPNFPWNNKSVVHDLLKEHDFVNIPRFKNTPGYVYMNKFNVISKGTFSIANVKKIDFSKKRDILIHYCASDSSNMVRPVIKKKLEKYSKYNINLQKLNNYQDSLENVLVSVNVPGWGPGCFRHNETFNAGCVCFAYDDISSVQLLPNNDLIDNEDYILFNLDNLYEKLDSILNDYDKLDKIRKNGYDKFCKSYDVDTNAISLWEWMYSYKMQITH